MRITVRVPATSANLGPGFDCFGLALELCNDVSVDTEAEPGVEWDGEGAEELPTDGTDLISRTIAHVGSFHDLTAPPLRLRGMNRIPLERGLGSSSAAVVAGVVLGSRLFDLSIDGHNTSPGADPYSVFALAAEVEGHPDNAAPAAFGGLTVIADGDVRRMEPHPELRPVALIPDVRLSTARARDVLPSQVARADAVFNVAHGALTIRALTDEPDMLRTVMRDRLHQDARLELVPAVRDVFRRLTGDGVPVCVSGAGPTLLAFESKDRPVRDPGAGWRVLRTTARSAGVEIRSA